MSEHLPDEDLIDLLGGKDEVIETCRAAWLSHWNNDHVKAGIPWGGECCIAMSINAVIGHTAVEL